MYKISVDLEKNRLYITAAGMFSGTEANEIVEEFAKALRQLRAHPDIIADASQYMLSGHEAAERIRRVYALVVEAKPRYFIRVRPRDSKTNAGLLQLDRLTWAEHANPETAASVDEAEKWLDANPRNEQDA